MTELAALKCPSCGAPTDGLVCGYCGTEIIISGRESSEVEVRLGEEISEFVSIVLAQEGGEIRDAVRSTVPKFSKDREKGKKILENVLKVYEEGAKGMAKIMIPRHGENMGEVKDIIKRAVVEGVFLNGFTQLSFDGTFPQGIKRSVELYRHHGFLPLPEQRYWREYYENNDSRLGAGVILGSFLESPYPQVADAQKETRTLILDKLGREKANLLVNALSPALGMIKEIYPLYLSPERAGNAKSNLDKFLSDFSS